MEREAESAVEKVDKAQTKKDNFIISGWNGGGKLIARLGLNPGLRKFLETTTDISHTEKL